MVSTPEDGFNFYDFADLNFPAFDGPVTPIQGDGTGLPQELDGANGDTPMLAAEAFNEQGRMEQMRHHPSDQMAAVNPYSEPYDLETELFNQQRPNQLRMQPQQYHVPNMVPPTPNSIELNAGQLQYYQPSMSQHQQQMYELYRRQQNDQVKQASPSMSPKLNPHSDGFYASRLSSRDPPGYTNPVSRLRSYIRTFQPFRLACSPDPDQRHLSIVVYSSTWFGYF